MTPKELVLSGYQMFAEGDLDGLGKIFHPEAVIRVNGDHELSGEYLGYENWRNNHLQRLPTLFPNFDLSILSITAEENRVQLHVQYSADNLDAQGVHMFVVEDGLEIEFTIFDDSQKLAKALSG
ncbi:MAG: hypothetical protein CL568_01025 [Alphaproteobacteria bacterium]|jgi:ketosteroid isomerase-like protein|nr:hypothetical protein [Alphaproteobacteria bacterium]PPR13545.1 MAG: hypothetical protein CFH42_01297 [Alphaproteobacteria bacterium MarineAlpha12_Bin1]|tara:strand:- start:13369 stop:13740 length:372 start_codon:yes stop_codon:yes gene_type:complete